jgi:uncharacterized Zn finger protein (UPF0148 family)
MAAKRGRPSTYTPEVAAEICARLAAGESLLEICQSTEMPSEATVRGWAIDDVKGFASKYARARDIGLDHEADEIRAIADTVKLGHKIEKKELGRYCSTCKKPLFWAGLGWMHGNLICQEGPICEGAEAVREYEEKTVEGDMIERAKLQIDARKWRLSKMAPKRYGDRLELAGDKDAPIQTRVEIVVVDSPKGAPNE